MIASLALVALLASPADPAAPPPPPVPAQPAAAAQAQGGSPVGPSHAAVALAGASLDELAKQLQNPLADLVSVPFQNNFNGGGAAGLGAAYNLNFQPVIPIELTRDWNLIVRPIVPYYSVPLPGGERSTGLGEIML